MNATRTLTAPRAPLPRAPRGRVCAHEGCTTRLTTYNLSDFCYLHDQSEEMASSRRCTACGEAFPLTAEYWHHDEQKADGFNNRCKTCRNAAQKRTMARYQGRRVCPVCKRRKLLTRKNFVRHRHGDWSLVCRSCEDAAEAEREAAKVTAITPHCEMRLDVAS
jgi:hypothetical protein